MISGTAFDVIVHLLNAYFLAQYLSLLEFSACFVMVVGASFVVLFSPRLAWSSPASVAPWIKRRLEPVDMKEVDASGLF